MSGLGYNVWLNYKRQNKAFSDKYRQILTKVLILTSNKKQDHILTSAEEELKLALGTFSNKQIKITYANTIYDKTEGLVIGTYNLIPDSVRKLIQIHKIPKNDGYVIKTAKNGQKQITVITAISSKGILYGTFKFIRLLQQQKEISSLNIFSEPKTSFRMLNHWDNLDGSIERGYAGKSLWKWDELPQKISSRYKAYARICASVGINASVLNNVNTQPEILSCEYLTKTAAIADVLRRYGITIYLSVNFASPILLGKLSSADPADNNVIQWWTDKIKEIYELIPDFGGFLMKADSEGQPGPFAYGKNHAEGANMFARILQKYGGRIIWRAFVYGQGETDRAKKAYSDFQPLDGKFLPNAILQIKNGAIDFQPREPVHPLFGAMPNTNLFMEFQITQEYLGQGNHLVYLAPMWKEILTFDTFASGKGTTVGKILAEKDGSGFAAVSNTGDNDDWCGSLFHPANLFAYGMLAWDYEADTNDIAREWAVCTWGHNVKLINAIMFILTNSWEACINYMTPLGLHHIMKYNHHYGPDPACDEGEREDWKPRYYHRADSVGLGFDRTETGSNAISQYSEHNKKLFGNLKTCPEKYLLWFHHVPWNYVLSSGRTLKEELVFLYKKGVEQAEELRDKWISIKNEVDSDSYESVLNKLNIQVKDAHEWQNVCVSYFLSFVDK